MGKGKEKILVKSKRQAHPIFKGKQQVPPKLQYLTRALSMFFQMCQIMSSLLMRENVVCVIN